MIKQLGFSLVEVLVALLLVSTILLPLLAQQVQGVQQFQQIALRQRAAQFLGDAAEFCLAGTHFSESLPKPLQLSVQNQRGGCHLEISGLGETQPLSLELVSYG